MHIHTYTHTHIHTYTHTHICTYTHMHLHWSQLGGSFLYEPEDMVDTEMVDGGRGGEGEGECVRCKLSCLAQKTLKRVFEGIVSGPVSDISLLLLTSPSLLSSHLLPATLPVTLFSFLPSPPCYPLLLPPISSLLPSSPSSHLLPATLFSFLPSPPCYIHVYTLLSFLPSSPSPPPPPPPPLPTSQNPEEIVDYHVHLVGHGDSGSGCHLHSSVCSMPHQTLTL